MQCPLKANRLGFSDNCNRDKCAWWDAIEMHCAIFTIAQVLALMNERLRRK